MAPILIETPGDMARWAGSVQRKGQTIGLVPTMGFLHRGHTSLMAQMRPRVDKLVVSIFVNPLQFGENEDLDTYPRDLKGDLEQCAVQGVDVVFAPVDLYPDGFSTAVMVHGLTDGLCGGKRPGHFEGVCTVVTRLFGLTRCDQAIFGEKDFQQLAVLRRMARDLALPVTLLGGPIVRDEDNVALSSRNAYLSTDQRSRAGSLSRALFAAVAAARTGETDAARLVASAVEAIDCDRLDYLELVDSGTLAPVDSVVGSCRMLAAAMYGNTRLIDNVAIGA